MRTIDQSRMPLGDHLEELRKRLVRVLVAVFVLSGLSFAFARTLFGFLMRPVLQALPSGSGSLVYTSAIEEINVYLKVGLYAGLCLSTPVVLWQLWGFVAPGLHTHERRLAGPFVLGGTLAFLLGTAFCYFAMLPPMFRFLLRDREEVALSDRLAGARLREQAALSALRRGDSAQAQEQSRAALAELEQQDSDDRGASVVRPPREEVEILALLEGLGRLLDATAHGATTPTPSPALAAQSEAIAAYGVGDFVGARASGERAAQAAAQDHPEGSAAIEAVWRLERTLGATLALKEASRWTRPMLSMNQQLSLVLLLELATGAVFELPLVMALLGMVGVVESDWLLRYQRQAFVVCLLAAAVITPTGDVVNLTLMGGPILACYELGVLLVWLVERRRRKRALLAPV